MSHRLFWTVSHWKWSDIKCAQLWKWNLHKVFQLLSCVVSVAIKWNGCNLLMFHAVTALPVLFKMAAVLLDIWALRHWNINLWIGIVKGFWWFLSSELVWKTRKKEWIVPRVTRGRDIFRVSYVFSSGRKVTIGLILLCVWARRAMRLNFQNDLGHKRIVIYWNWAECDIVWEVSVYLVYLHTDRVVFSVRCPLWWTLIGTAAGAGGRRTDGRTQRAWKLHSSVEL